MEQLPARIRAARERLGLTQDILASAISVSRSAISDIESGKREVTAPELAILSALLGQPMEALLGVQEAASREAVMFRAAEMPESTRAQVAHWLYLCETYQEIESAIGDARSADLRPVQRIMSAFEQAYDLAEEERKRLGLGLAPAHELLDAIEERLGVKVFHLDLDDSCSGASVMSSQFGPAILVNRKHTSGRRVFTLAHEYFHLLTIGRISGSGAAQGVHLCAAELVVEGGRRRDRAEQLADRFAGRLLMPSDHFIDRLKSLRAADGTLAPLDLVGLARYFGVSVQAVFVQLGVLKLVPSSLAQEGYRDPMFQSELATLGGGEPGPEPKRFARVVAKALLAGEISRGRAAELLGVNIVAVDAEVRRYGGADGIRLSLPR